ncbi:helix-turn-helix domain-containing protein [Streptomyces turgidiscabies]|uniref:Transcriptional regulator with XRE-family HTH domain n=1 Tax=Streptomyces turgidiscabies TaxID=85558 RepID=A0ABU0RVI8_9ACTN|nr:helix-turn-helix transcriptional regulator [Streptomyces turgidiscabies]MDQ0935177.1 transcriptional regulator with XRE-family HTH domain [Streptomyces turgidiscabies]
MATSPSQPEACVVCAGPLVQNSGAGRRRRYCGTACRRRAQRHRQARQVPVVEQQGPLGRAVAAEVRRLAQQLVDSEMREEELGTLLERAEAIRREVDIYTAAAVQDARHRGEKWESVARAAHVAPETARARWGPERVARMMDLHANEKRAAPARWRGPGPGRLGDAAEGPSDSGAEGVSPANQLASALTQLQAASGLTIREVADSTMLSPSFISRVLSGDRLPTWDLVCALAVLFRSDPAELRVLFETAHGVTAPGRQPVAAAIAQLHAAVRGLYLAARSPTPERIEQLSAKAVSARTARRVLAGVDVPEWEVLAALACALGGRPEDLKPLWEAVHYTFLMCDDPHLPEGTAHIAVPGQPR